MEVVYRLQSGYIKAVYKAEPSIILKNHVSMATDHEFYHYCNENRYPDIFITGNIFSPTRAQISTWYHMLKNSWSVAIETQYLENTQGCQTAGFLFSAIKGLIFLCQKLLSIRESHSFLFPD